jgi:hypothetical protein
MIQNFEEITEDLTEQEIQFIPEMTQYFKIVLSGGIVQKQSDITEIINMKLVHAHGPSVFKITPMRLRKYFNYFRSNGILPIIATSNGCYISYDKEEIEKQILSMKQRARQIERAAIGMGAFL